MAPFAPKPKTEAGRSVVVRWRILAQRRLEHLVELYESGRWKLYHSESDFLAMVQEAKGALKVWQELAPPDPALDKTVEISLAQETLSAEADIKTPTLLDRVDPEHDILKS